MSSSKLSGRYTSRYTHTHVVMQHLASLTSIFGGQRLDSPRRLTVLREALVIFLRHSS
jgi:hypothetical protein